jgi:hypothetical protein
MKKTKDASAQARKRNPVQALLDAAPSYTLMQRTLQGFRLRWGRPGTGFGEITWWRNRDGSWRADTECMGDKFVAGVFMDWLKTVKREG